MIKKFNRIAGRCVEKIYGQDRFGYSQSDFEDLYDLIKWAGQGGYQGAELQFYDFYTGDVYKPFDKKIVTLYRYIPKKVLEAVAEFNIEKVNLYNLKIIGSPLFVISQDNEDGFRCYYPEKISFPLQEQETVILIEDGKVYLEKWIEEGWDKENDCATDTYQYYNKIIIKDFAGNTISEEAGCLNQSENGDWWIS